MIRVVLDTNILISALLSPLGPPSQVFLMTLLDPDTQLCVSGEIYAEYEEVVRRPRFNRSDSEIEATLRGRKGVRYPFLITTGSSLCWAIGNAQPPRTPILPSASSLKGKEYPIPFPRPFLRPFLPFPFPTPVLPHAA